MRKNKDYSLSFDRFSRQARAFDVIESLRSKDRKFKILDVGGYRGLTREMHVDDSVTILDLYDVDEPNYIKGNGLSMPFDDNSYDFVVSFDVFEHIPDVDREKFIQESARVAKVAVITAAPIRTEANQLAEKCLNELHVELYAQEHEWLKEHVEYGLPRPQQAAKTLEALGLKTVTFGSNDTVLWTLMQAVIFLNARFPEGEEGLGKLNKAYNRIAYNDGTSDPLESYRHVVCGFKKPEDALIAKKYLEKHSAVLNVAQKVEIAHLINEQHVNTIRNYTKLYEALYKKFEEKVEEKDLLLQTIENISREKDELTQELMESRAHTKGALSIIKKISKKHD